SWMAFRSYHSPIFKSFQQKDISGFLTRMWQNDPFKAKWSILAKAYSTIRESNTKDAAPLDKFLALTCPLIGIIPRDDYLGVMGWSIVDTAGVKIMERMYTPDISSFPENILTTNLSSEEIVAHCQRVSYVDHNDTDVARNQSLTAALAMAAQPMFESAPEETFARNHHAGHIQQNNNMVGNSDSATTFTSMAAQPASHEASSSPPVFDFSNPESPYQPDGHDLFVGGATIQGALNQNNNNAIGASGPVRQAVHNLSSQQYPFMDEFDPFQSSSLDFDPFNMNQDNAFASNSIGTYLAPSNNDFPETFNIDDLLSSDLFDMTK
ncbi:mating-type protein MAT alpha 1, partial [Aureobasidium melanogenum]